MKPSGKTNRLAITSAAIALALISPVLIAQDAATNTSNSDSVLIAGQVTEVMSNATEVLAATNQPAAGSEERHPHQNRRGPIVAIAGSAELKDGEIAEAVVAVGGSARARGKVQDAVVAIGGDADVEGDVGDAVVAVGGNARLKGKVNDAVVAIAGNAEVEGSVGDAVVAVVGNVEIKPGSVIEGDVVAVGGKVHVAEGAKVKGEIVEVGTGDFPLLVPLKGAADWLKHCAIKFRLVAPGMGWAWVVPGVFLLFYIFIALICRKPVEACVNVLVQRPATTFLLGVLAKILLPIIITVLAMTVVGGIIVPFLVAAVFVGSAIGKVALLQHLGRQSFRLFGILLPGSVLAVFVGFVMITLLYMVPVLSLMIYFLFGLWALGVAATAAFGRAKKETPTPPAAFTSPPAGTQSTAMSGAQFVASTPTAEQSTTSMPGTPGFAPSGATASVSEALLSQRAGFWERMGAAFLDVVIVSVVSAVCLASHLLPPPVSFLIALAYFAGLWAWRGTTLGGIVLNLKVVRADDKPLTFVVALVRGLASVLSVMVFFLGFLWIAFDRDKQAWHDKIAGTVVIRVPRGLSLVCL